MLLEVSGVDAGYGDIRVLQDLSLDIDSGEVVCLIGSNGAGKTTSMRTLCGLLKPAAGAIRLNGEDITRAGAEQVVARGIALVPEGRRVFAPLSVRENLEMGGYRFLRKGDRRGVADSMEFVFGLFPRLRERADQTAGTLSGGEQQMLAIGRGLMSRPKVMLLDEPSMGLAPIIVSEIFRIVEDLNKEGLTILLAEQNARMALRVADRGYVLQSGRIVKSGSAEQLMEDEGVRQAYLGL